MRRFLLCFSAFLLCAAGFASCEKNDPDLPFSDKETVPAFGQYISFSSGDIRWEGTENLGSCYAKTSNPAEPSWYDLVVCTEDVNDFDIDFYRHYLFLHIDLDSLQNVKAFRLQYYKNKNTERVGDFELFLSELDGGVTLSKIGDSLSGEFAGTLRNNADPTDTRPSRLCFRNIPVQGL